MSPIPEITVYHADQCDRRKCTGLRLVRMKRALMVRSLLTVPHSAVVLNPIAETALSPSDRVHASHHGLVALDCSWNQAEQIFADSGIGHQRALPYLLAANPVNTYKPIKLSTAEAVAAALYIMGFKTGASDVMSVFKWGPSFIPLNLEWLEAYSMCSDSSEVVRVQREIMQEQTRNEIS